MNQERLTLALAVALAAGFSGSLARAQSRDTTAKPALPSLAVTNSLMSTFQKPALHDLKQKLNPIQFEVTQHAATEPAFQNAFWNNHRPGLYVDIVSGKPLFSSLDKFDSGCGWPSFTRPIEDQEVMERPDHTYGMERVEVRSKTADSHLGHVFKDGPAPTGLRYCINSASLRFIPVEAMEQEGYGAFLQPFVKAGIYKPAPKPAAPTQDQ